MFTIADGLTRLLAPILPMTTDELWRHLPGRREESIHLAEFPRDVDQLIDAALVARWDRLMQIRDEVNRALEAERKAKTIGNSLGAKVTLRAGGADGQLLEQYREELPMLLIVSQVDVERIAGNEGAPVGIAVTRATGEKCARCWRIVAAVSGAGATEGLCDRCVDALQGAAGRVAG
jgi:isoleucyl-tRNA synthetase